MDNRLLKNFQTFLRSGFRNLLLCAVVKHARIQRFYTLRAFSMLNIELFSSLFVLLKMSWIALLCPISKNESSLAELFTSEQPLFSSMELLFSKVCAYCCLNFFTQGLKEKCGFAGIGFIQIIIPEFSFDNLGFFCV